MSFNAGDVIRLPFFRHTENSDGEARWGIILEDLGDEFLVIGLTKQVHQKHHYPDGFIIEKDSTDGKLMGLEHTSLVACGSLGIRKEFRLKKKFFRIPPMEKFGICPDHILERIEKCSQ